VGTVFVRAALNDDPCDLYAVRAEVAVLTELRVFAKVNCSNSQNFEVLANGVMGWISEYSMHDFVPDPTGVAVSNEDNITDLGERTVINNYLQEQFGPFVTLEFSTVSPVVSSAAVRNATLAIAVATLFIMAYVRFAFSTVPKPSRYAVCAIIALIHDTVIVIGAFSLFGKLFGAEINLMFVTGILTAIGFSVHDSIVVFDRIRENITANPQSSLSENVNSALLQTMARSLNTSLTLLLPIGALLLLGGDTIQSFLLAILVGVVVGTYSSVAIAAQLLVAWEQGDLSRWFSKTPWSNKARA
jgi:preprotein translocase subunit SecF